MSTNVRVMQCDPQDVFDVLADGWLYPSWVVGASRTRAVDDSWPLPGSRLHHSFGVWPALLNDETLTEKYDPPHSMIVRPKGWPMGESRVILHVKPRADSTVVRMQKYPIAGPGKFVHGPLMEVALHWRNREALRRLGYLAEGRAGTSNGRRTSLTRLTQT